MSRNLRSTMALMAALHLSGAACAGSPEDVSLDQTTLPPAEAPAAMSVAAGTVPPRTSPPVVSTTVPPRYTAVVAPIDDVTRSRMSFSWRPGCPVPLEDLRLLTLAHWGFDGEPLVGELVVHESVAEDLVTVFGALWDARFPIERMELVDVFEGDDDRSMAADNTSAFNCREIDGRPGTWSNHAYGRAVDINPRVNPWVRGDLVDPPGGAAFLDRTLDAPGLVRDGDVVVAAFAAAGWSWGGHWSTPDYQHFEHPVP